MKNTAALQRKPARRDEKRPSASGSARTPFRGGLFCSSVFSCDVRFETSGLIVPFKRLRFS